MNAELYDTEKKENAVKRLYGLLSLQKELIERFGEENYNVFFFGSYITTAYREGESDVDIAVYTEDFALYLQVASYLEAHFSFLGIPSDIFYIDTTMPAPIFCAPLKSKVQFTDYYPEKLQLFKEQCQRELSEVKRRIAV